jgi:hypothetical protein
VWRGVTSLTQIWIKRRLAIALRFVFWFHIAARFNLSLLTKAVNQFHAMSVVLI